MKVFIILLISCTTLISVEADIVSENKAFIFEKAAIYKNMTELELKANVKLTINTLVTMMKNVSALYRPLELEIEADNYDKIGTSILEELPKILIILDKEKIEERMPNLIKLGVIIEMIKFKLEVEIRRRIANPLNVGLNTEGNSEKKFHEIVNKILALLKSTVEVFTKRKNLFWADIHQKCYEFMSSMVEGLEVRMKMLKSDAIRAKNYQVMVDDLTILFSVTSSMKLIYVSSIINR